MRSAAAATYLNLIDLERSEAKVTYSLKPKPYVTDKSRGTTYATVDLYM